MRIKKVINNNILCVIDEKGNEMIVTGKGLGFGRKVAQFVDPAQVEKVYRMEGAHRAAAGCGSWWSRSPSSISS